MTEDKQHVVVHCRVCGEPVDLEISAQELQEQKNGILRVMFVHGNPLHAIIASVDKNRRVRGIEYPDSFQMGETRTTTVVSQSEVSESLSESMGEPCYQSLYSYDDSKDREQASFVLDKTILRAICESGTICLCEVRQKVAPLEKALGDRIDLKQIQTICERFIEDGLIRNV